MSRTVDFWPDRVNGGARLDVNVRRLLYEMGLDLNPFVLLSAESADEVLANIEVAIVQAEDEWLLPLRASDVKLTADDQGLARVRSALVTFIRARVARRDAPFDMLMGARHGG